MPAQGVAGRTEPAEEQLPRPPGPAAPALASSRPRAMLHRLAGRLPPGWLAPLATYMACQMIFLFWWAAFYPGLISWDSVTYVKHVTQGPWVNNHSVLYDALVWLSLHTTGGLGALTLAQTVAMSAALAYTVAALGRLGVRGRWTAVAAVAVAALPPTGTFIVYVWKDVAFSICTSFLVATVADLLSRRGAAGWRRDRRVTWLVAAVGLELLGMCLFRLNGFVVAVLAAALLVPLLRGIRGPLAAVAAAAVLLTFALNWYAYPAAGIRRAPTVLAFATAYEDIAVAYAQRPSSFTAADTRLMSQVVPLSVWRNTADCYTTDGTVYYPGFGANAARHTGQLVSLWLRVLGRSPDLVVGARICRGSIAWRVLPGPQKLAGNTQIKSLQVPSDSLYRLGHTSYRYAVLSRPLSAPAHKLAVFSWRASRTPQLEWLLWRGAFWCYLSYLAVFGLARARRRWSLLALAAIVAAQQLGILVDIPAQEFRYMASTILIGIMFVPLLFARDRQARPG